MLSFIVVKPSPHISSRYVYVFTELLYCILRLINLKQILIMVPFQQINQRCPGTHLYCVFLPLLPMNIISISIMNKLLLYTFDSLKFKRNHIKQRKNGSFFLQL